MKSLRILCLVLVACGPEKNPECNQAGVVHDVPQDRHHVDSCESTHCGNAHNPPTGGPHCPTPAACTVYDEPVHRCQWVHNLEHGHVALLYSCPDGCDGEREKLEALADDVEKGDNGVRKALVSEDPLLPDGTLAVVVWGWAWHGKTIDDDAVECVLAHRGEEAPEPNLDCPAP